MSKQILVARTKGGEYVGYDVPPAKVAEVEEWLRGLRCIDEVWHESVRRFHQRFPKPEDAYV